MSMLPPVDGMHPWPFYTRPLTTEESDYLDAYWTEETGEPPSSFPPFEKDRLGLLLINANPPEEEIIP